MELVGIGLNEIICQESITKMLLGCERQSTMLLYYRIINKRTMAIWFQVRGKEFNERKDLFVVHAGLFNIDNQYLGESAFVREFCKKEKNYRPWRMFPGRDQRDRYKDCVGVSFPSQITGLIVTIENPRGEIIHL